MATYMVRGLEGKDIGDFKARCREAGISPDDLLKQVIKHSTPEYLIDLDETRVTHRFCFHHPGRPVPA